ncbi:hypothetical protein KY363_02615 [Candidatus Woesearchaeota archaeon]|nr:hypothetical protein [Candidatus Woesearchaeota archaeon]
MEKEQGAKPLLELRSFETYMKSGIGQLKWQLSNYFDDASKLEVEHVREKLLHINQYENIEHLQPIKEEHIVILDEDTIDTSEAEQVVLNGEFFWEHAAAGEATRLGLGTKYLLDLSDMSIPTMIEMRKKEIENDMKGQPEKAKALIAELTEDNLVKQMGCRPEELLPLSLGTRHMLQAAYDLTKLAKKHGKDPAEVIGKQKMLIILNETSSDQVIDEFIRYNFFGFARRNTYFMVQKSFHGIDLAKGEPFYDMGHDKHKRLHNHGQMAMQKTHDNAIFYIDEENAEHYVISAEFEKVLSGTKDMVSYNIEDIGYLTNAIDWHSLALSLELGKKGYGMTMEIVAQNPLRPQKGGACFWDDKKKRVVMIESNQLRDMKNEDIKHLNKNFNHYPNPAEAFRAVRDGKMHLHTDVKLMADSAGNPKYYIYFCTPQGDINFLVKTAYIMRKNLKPIANWKSPATTPPTVAACHEQDMQPGFKEFAEKTLGTKL